MDLSLHESDCDKFSLDLLSSNDEKEFVIEDDGKEKDTCKVFEHDEKEVLLDNNKHILKLVWKKHAGGYLWEVRECGSSAMENWDISRKKELEKFTSQTQLIVDMFLATQNKKQSSSQPTSLVPTLFSPMFKKVETKFELRV